MNVAFLSKIFLLEFVIQVAEFSPKIIGMLISAALIGLIIGSVCGLLISFLFSNSERQQAIAKRGMVAGGLLGAVSGCGLLAYFIF